MTLASNSVLPSLNLVFFTKFDGSLVKFDGPFIRFGDFCVAFGDFCIRFAEVTGGHGLVLSTYQAVPCHSHGCIFFVTNETTNEGPTPPLPLDVRHPLQAVGAAEKCRRDFLDSPYSSLMR